MFQTWLSKLATEMKQTLTELLKQCLRDAKSGRFGGLDPNKYPSQILCLCEMVQFTERCEEALGSHGLQNLHADMEQQLESYTSVDITSSGQGDVDAQVLELKLKVRARLFTQKIALTTKYFNSYKSTKKPKCNN